VALRRGEAPGSIDGGSSTPPESDANAAERSGRADVAPASAERRRPARGCLAPTRFRETQDHNLALRPSPRRSTWKIPALLLLCLAVTLGCFFHTGFIRIVPPAAPGTQDRNPLSDDAIRAIVQAVDEVAKDKGFRTKRVLELSFGSDVLANYYSPEQISISVRLARHSGSIRVRIRDVNHTSVTPFTESIRSEISERVSAQLPDHVIFYEVP
jgi:hypothetical protein